MLLQLYAVFIGLALALVIVGLVRPTETAQALIGFFFLFLLAFPLLNGEIEYKIGFEETYIYGNNFTGYHWDYENLLEPRPQDDTKAYIFHINETSLYSNFDDTLSHRLGYYLAIASAIGFIGTLFGIANTTWGRDE